MCSATDVFQSVFEIKKYTKTHKILLADIKMKIRDRPGAQRSDNVTIFCFFWGGAGVIPPITPRAIWEKGLETLLTLPMHWFCHLVRWSKNTGEAFTERQFES